MPSETERLICAYYFNTRKRKPDTPAQLKLNAIVRERAIEEERERQMGDAAEPEHLPDWWLDPR